MLLVTVITSTQDIILNRSFVKAVLETALPAQTDPVSDVVKAPHLLQDRLAEQIAWVKVALYAGLRQRVRDALGVFFPSHKAAAILRRVRNEQLWLLRLKEKNSEQARRTNAL